MKSKSLTSTLVASTVILVANTPVFVHANENLLTIYGQAHLSADYVDVESSSSTHIASSSSRLGLKGEYQLGDEFFAICQYESGIDLTGQGYNDGNGGALSDGQFFTKTRPSYLGLRGKYGTALFGHMPALDQWANDFNFFADQVGDLGNFWEASGVPGRSDNVFYYRSPEQARTGIAITHKPEDIDGPDTEMTIIKASYVTQAMQLGAAYSNVGQGLPSAGMAALETHKVAAFTLKYDLGAMTLGAGYQFEDDIKGVNDVDRDNYALGASYKLCAKSAVKMQVAYTDSKEDETSATMFAAGYDHRFNDNVLLYVAAAIVSNDDNVNFAVNGKGHGDKITPLLGDDAYSISFGFVSTFDIGLM